MAKSVHTEVNGQKLKLTNLQKVLYPNSNFVKAEVIAYYLEVSKFMLPHLGNRPLTLIRFPDGINGKSFYTKNAPGHTPAWISTVNIDTDLSSNAHILAQNSATLVWLANLAALEIHPFLSLQGDIENPDHFIFDLDPPENAEFEICKKVAKQIGDFLRKKGYHPFLKTSGGKGLHIYVPIFPEHPYEIVKKACKTLATEFIKDINSDCTIQMQKERRKNKVLLDIHRNHKGNSCVAPYSLRGKPMAPISTPIAWSELESLRSSKEFNLSNIYDRISHGKDAWHDWPSYATHLKQLPAPPRSTISKIDAKINLPKYSHMLAKASDTIPDHQYSFEIKWDGIRAFFIKNGHERIILSRNGNDISRQFPLLISSMDNIKSNHVVLDGEIVCLDKDGKPIFRDVISRLHTSQVSTINSLVQSKPAHAYLFDILFVDKKDVTKKVIEVRRQHLNQQIIKLGHFRISEVMDQGQDLFKAIRQAGMEGIMAKKKGSIYTNGLRSANWLKIKSRSITTCVIIGYTKGNGERLESFGALHLAVKKEDEIIYRGKVGTGFNYQLMSIIRDKMNHAGARQNYANIVVEDERNTTWINPILHCEVQYASMTHQDTFREAVFIKLVN